VNDDCQKRIRALERENRILRNKLRRSEINRARLEDFKEANTLVYRNVISEMRDTQTRLETSERRAQQANTAKSIFLANMSHELRTPLTAVLGYAELLLEPDADLGTTQRDDVLTIMDSAQHLLQIIDTLLDLSKIESEQMDFATTEVQLDEVIDQALKTAQPLVEANRSRLDVVRGGALPVVFTDPTRLLQVLLNLLSNAAKFTEEGVVTLAATQEPGRIQLRVEDTGIGMTSEQLARAYQPFEQASTATSRKYGGTGLGLAVARRLCDGMGYELVGESQPGEGTVFVIEIPHAEEEHLATLP